MYSKIISGIFILALLLTCCVSEYDTALPENNQKILFVDGSIIANTNVTFHISRGFSLHVESISKIPKESLNIDAKLTIIGSNGFQSPPAVKQLVKKRKGKEEWTEWEYRIAVGELSDDVKYGIQIEYDGDTYQSALSKPLYTPEIDSISWTQPEAEGPVFFHISTHDNTGGSKFYMWTYTEDWETKAVYPTPIFYDPNYSKPLGEEPFYVDFTMPLYYCWKKNESDKFSIGSTESLGENRIVNKLLFEHASENDRFSILYSVIVNQRAISRSAYEYYQNIKKLNEEMGGLFTPQPSELIGNISCITDPSKKVIGYVETVKNISHKRIFVESEELIRPPVYSSCGRLPDVDLPQEAAQAYWYRLGYRPAVLNTSLYYEYGVVVPTEWALAHCTDCRATPPDYPDYEPVPTKNKPDFWPNWHW